MGIVQVKEYFRKAGMEDRILEFDESSATVELAAERLGCEPARIAKSLTFLVNDKPVMVVAAGDARIDNHKFKSAFQTKAKMLSRDQVEMYIGHPVGGVCPFAVKEGVEIFLDESLKRFETVFPAAGSGNSAIELNLGELERLSGCKGWLDVCK